jgi:colanic acid biosynthesis protein WcaH
MLDKQTFLNVVQNAPLVAVDFLLMRGNEVLLGLRNNRPAQHFWFVPGGRILKNETITQALLRVADNELGLAELVKNGQLKVTFYGTYEHFYGDCFAGVDISTHYVVLAHQVILPKDFDLPLADDQHSAYQWWPIEALLASDQVHQYSKNYFLKEFGSHA